MLATALWERWNNFCLKLSVSFDLFLSGWIKEILSKDQSSSGVRIGVKSGGCAGMSYVMEYAKDKNSNDELIEDNNIKLLVNKKSFLYLVGTTLEFSDGLNGKGFVFNNPNASRTCGCGESFSL